MGGPLDQNRPGSALSRTHAAGPPRPPGERGRSAGAWPWLVDGPGWWMALAGAWPWLVRGPGWCVAPAGAWPWLVRGPGWCVGRVGPGGTLRAPARAGSPGPPPRRRGGRPAHHGTHPGDKEPGAERAGDAAQVTLARDPDVAWPQPTRALETDQFRPAAVAAHGEPAAHGARGQPGHGQVEHNHGRRPGAQRRRRVGETAGDAYGQPVPLQAPAGQLGHRGLVLDDEHGARLATSVIARWAHPRLRR